MRNVLARTLVSVAVLLLSTMAMAGERVPVGDFARHADLSMPRLSPDGKHLAVSMTDPDTGSHSLVVYKIADMSRPVSMLRLAQYELPTEIVWVSNTRLVVAKGRQFGSINQPMSTGEIIATDLDGKMQIYLYGYQSPSSLTNGMGSIDGVPSPTNGHFYMAAQSWNNQRYSTLYDVESIRNALHTIGKIKGADFSFMVGADGKAHFAYGRNDNWEYVVFHQDDGEWTPMTREQVGGTFAPLFFTPDQHGIYATYNIGGGPTALVEQTEQGAGRMILASDSFSSIGNIEWTALPYQPFATAPATGKPVPTYIDANSTTSRLHQVLSKKFADNYVHFVDFSEDGSKLLFSVASDRNPGAYYLIDTHTFQFSKLFDLAPWIDPQQMAERRSMRFKASDGMELEAILTAPKGVDMHHLPMVLIPHGGPIGVKDDWFFDYDAQFLANRGYLVLQVNYRGSGGRGVDFQEAGYLKWGTRIQQDLIDGVAWAVKQDFADKDRVCVYGASFGGYSAMMTTIRAPGMFKCAVGYAGIYDLKMMYKKGDIRDSKSGRSYLHTVIGRDDADLDANSPVKLADKIGVPVFLVHGEDDQRAPFAQAKAMRAALDAAHKPYEWMSKPGEGHGFYSEKNNIELYDKLQAFLEKYIGPGVPAA